MNSTMPGKTTIETAFASLVTGICICEVSMGILNRRPYLHVRAAVVPRTYCNSMQLCAFLPRPIQA